MISAGVIMNMIFAFAIYAGGAGFWGIRDVASTQVGKVYEGLLPAGTEALGQLPPGAMIRFLGDREVENWTEVAIPLTSAGIVTITPGSPSDHVSVAIPDLGTTAFARLKVSE